MAFKMIYTCDHCKKEITETQLIEDYDIELGVHFYRCNLCNNCRRELNKLVSNFIDSTSEYKIEETNELSKEPFVECMWFEDGRCKQTLSDSNCICGGNKLKCSFFEDVKHEAKQQHEKELDLL